MKRLNIVLLTALAIGTIGYSRNSQYPDDMVVENDEMRLIISSDGTAKSLLHKPTNEECLMQNVKVPAFSIKINENYRRPYDDFHKASMITMGPREFFPDSVFRRDDKLIVHFDTINIYATINLDCSPKYIHFRLEDVVYSEKKYLQNEFFNRPRVKAPEFEEMWFLRLPVRERTHFGNVLNVMWDDRFAVNLLGTDHYTRIDSEEHFGYHILKAGGFREAKSTGVGAGLIATSTKKLLDNIAQVEEDFDLPQGVKNRRRKESKLSTYWTNAVNPDNVDKHIEYARKAGLRSFFIYYPAFIDATWEKWASTYPNGIEDLQAVIRKIESAGMIAGVHIHYNKAHPNQGYVTPVPDRRLNIRQHFTLAAPLGKHDTTVVVGENPAGVTLWDGQRILRFGDEFISYSDYSSTVPYEFTGCTRGAFKTTTPESHQIGTIGGILDFDPPFILFNQDTNIREEVAKRVAEIYKSAGFKFVYFDGADDVHSPYWFNCSRTQWEVWRRLKPEPIFGAGAAFSHFSWHMLSRGNHYDTHVADRMKEGIRRFPAYQAPLSAKNFTSSNFGRHRHYAPGTRAHGQETILGTQPDMFEYLTSRAAAWDSPWCFQVSSLKDLDAHPRTSDVLEVIRRWEEVKAQDWLTDEHKQMLRNLEQEHILLINEQKEFELVPCDQIKKVAQGNEQVRAFIFERRNAIYVVYWHCSANNRKLVLPVSRGAIALLEELGQELTMEAGGSDNSVIIPADRRRYIRTDKLSRKQLINALENASTLE